MKFHKNKFLTTVSAIALVLAVGACGSSSDDNEGMSMLQTDLDAATAKAAALQEDLDEANAALIALETLIGDEMNPDPASVRGMLAQANLDLGQARTDLQMAMDNSDDEMEIAKLKQAVTDAEDMRDGYKTDLDEANLELLAAKEAKDTLETEKMDKADSDMAKEVLAAIGVNTGPPDVVPDPDPAAVEFKAPSDDDLTATLTGYTMSAAPEEIAGWRGRMLKNEDGDTTVIYTNIEDAEAKTIGEIYDSASDFREPDHYYDVVADASDDTEDDIPWSVVKRDDEDSTTTGSGDTATTTFAGSVSGVAGTFSCTGADCDLPTTGADGALTSAQDWTFVPNDPNGTIDIEDDAYVSFGWWLNAMGTMGEYEFDAFASVEGMAARAVAGGTVDGSATYKGAAAGKWAMQSTSDDSASGGHFTAAATLTADFDADTGTDPDTPNELGVSIGGSITDFMTGDVSRPNWRVKLTGPETVPATIEDAGVEGTTSWTTGGAVPGTGTWNAIFYGGMPEDQPAAAAGEFDAAIPASGEIGRISGAFGATKVPE